MANLQAAVRSQSMTTLSPTECLSRTNGLLYHSTAPEKFATAFYGIIDPVGDTLSFCNAGHESPYLLGPDGSQRQLSTGGIMLGVVDGFPFNEETVPFPPGSTLVVFSDGVTEATDEEGTMFGADRVREVGRAFERPPCGVDPHRTPEGTSRVRRVSAPVRRHHRPCGKAVRATHHVLSLPAPGAEGKAKSRDSRISKSALSNAPWISFFRN